MVRTAASQLSTGELVGLFAMIVLALVSIVLIEWTFDRASADDNDQDMRGPRDRRDGDG